MSRTHLLSRASMLANPHLTFMQDCLIRPEILSGIPGLFAAFTTRHFAGPSRAQAEAAATRLAEAEGFYGITFTEQVHGNRVAVVEDPGTVPGHDGLVTRRHGLLIGTVAADCALVLMADPEAGVVGSCHAGWRGAAAGIVTRTLAMMEEVGARPNRILAYVGPCISVDHFEVGEEVAERFADPHVHRRPDWQRPHLDLRAAVVAHLEAGDVAASQIEVSDTCTIESPEQFFSYRGENGTPGRMLGLIGIQ